MKRHLDEQRRRKPVAGGRREPEDTVRGMVFIGACLVLGLYLLALALAGVVWVVGLVSGSMGGGA